ncbi:hypothetical protein [Maricaulis sp.]|uniref:hypothetical protein n=1 Tax=unclassified Maricaulis TaxID=2632371 RepID=UPI001B02D4DB|nr:hypothetical protein [Maricaulis sp.]MBO6797264.1 hypothetical protein [Maricaulis sp.]
MFGRMAMTGLTVMVAMVLALAILVLLGVYAPLWLHWVQNGADLIERAVTSTGLPSKYNVWVGIFAASEAIVILIFTIIARVILAIGLAPFSSRMNGIGTLLASIGSMTASLFFAFVLGILMLVSLGIVAPDILDNMLSAAGWVEARLENTGLPFRWNNILRLLVADDQILLLFFTIVARMLIAILATSVSSAVGGNEAHYMAPAR